MTLIQRRLCGGARSFNSPIFRHCRIRDGLRNHSSLNRHQVTHGLIPARKVSYHDNIADVLIKALPVVGSRRCSSHSNVGSTAGENSHHSSNKVLVQHSYASPSVATSIFSRFEVLFNTGVIDCRDQLIKLRCLPSDKGGLGMPSLEGHHGRCHQLITAMRSSTVRGPILRELQFKSCSFSAKLHFRIRECLKYQVY